MRDIILFVVLIVGTLAGLVYLRKRDTRYLEKPTREVLSPKLKVEIEEEREANLEKKKKFEEILKKTGGG